MQTLKGDDVVEPLLHLLQNRLANGPKGLIFGDVCALTPYNHALWPPSFVAKTGRM